MNLLKLYQLAIIWLAISVSGVLLWIAAPNAWRWLKGEVHWRKVRRHAVRRLMAARERDRERWTP